MSLSRVPHPRGTGRAYVAEISRRGKGVSAGMMGDSCHLGLGQGILLLHLYHRNDCSDILPGLCEE